MKSKNLNHPRLYVNIVEKTKEFLLLEFKDNQFDEKGNRIIKSYNMKIKESYQNNLKDIEILNKLNEQEFDKINNYIKTQKKVLEYHKKHNNYDSIHTVKDSIETMQTFKKEFLISEF